jgi:hypothetical protein
MVKQTNQTYVRPTLSEIELDVRTVLCSSSSTDFGANDVQYDDTYKNAFGSYED